MPVSGQRHVWLQISRQSRGQQGSLQTGRWRRLFGDDEGGPWRMRQTDEVAHPWSTVVAKRPSAVVRESVLDFWSASFPSPRETGLLCVRVSCPSEPVSCLAPVAGHFLAGPKADQLMPRGLRESAPPPSAPVPLSPCHSVCQLGLAQGRGGVQQSGPVFVQARRLASSRNWSKHWFPRRTE